MSLSVVCCKRKQTKALGMLISGRKFLAGAVLATVPVSVGVITLRATAGLRHPASTSYDDLLVAGAGWALVLGGGWAALVCSAAVLEVASSGRLAFTAHLGCPEPVRRTLLAGLGVLLASGGAVVAGPVAAEPPPLGQVGARARPGLPVPARPTGAAYTVPRQRVEVQPGDSLWRLSQRRAAPRADTRDVARMVERTYRANRRVIGPDPDLIRPGQRLRLPRQRSQTPPPHPGRETP
jgi:hypothetical protein